jgi:hypothetical protein
MSEETIENVDLPGAPPIQNLTDFVYGADLDNPVEVDIVVNEHGKVVVFHSHVFRDDLGWFECDLDERKLLFVFDDGRNVDAGIKLSDTMKKYMQNSHQILTVLLDHETGDAKEGHYYPLILQKR